MIYVSIQNGFGELERMPSALNTGRVAFQEPYPYHPHVTIAQELAPKDVHNAAQFARWRWSEFKHSRSAWIDASLLSKTRWRTVGPTSRC